jgi:hypothetical protein
MEMKKLYTTLLLILPFITKAQTITQADLPTVGTAFTMAHDTAYQAPAPPAGMGQNWDYSTLLNQKTDTTLFMDATGTPYTGTFPTSNLVTIDPTDTSYTYFTSNSSGLYVDGFYSSSFHLSYTPSQLYLPVPFTFNDVRSSVARALIDTNVIVGGTPQHVNVHIESDDDFIADGTGTLITPTGTYNNVLRVKVTSIMYDSTFVIVLGSPVFFSASATQTVTYQFVTSGNQVNYIMSLDADSLGTTISGAQYLVASVQLAVPNIQAKNDVRIYPNPVVNTINFSGSLSQSEITIFNERGMLVYRSKLSDAAALNVESFSHGNYFYEVKNGDNVYKGSFIKQ